MNYINLSIFCLAICFIPMLFIGCCMVDGIQVQQPCYSNYRIIHVFSQGDNWQVWYQEFFDYNACSYVIIPKTENWEKIAHIKIQEQISYIPKEFYYHNKENKK
jgi:hypothetical protein